MGTNKYKFKMPHDAGTFVRRESQTERAKVELYEEHYGKPKPTHEPELAAALEKLRSKKT